MELSEAQRIEQVLNRLNQQPSAPSTKFPVATPRSYKQPSIRPPKPAQLKLCV